MMKRVLIPFLGLLLLCVSAQGQAKKAEPQPLGGKDLSGLLPDQVFLDGQRIPVQKRNSVAARMENGKILLVMLLDTAGYSADIKEKYTGMLITQGSVTLGSRLVRPGVYGLGRKKGARGETFALYDVGGNPVAEFPAEKDAKLRPVTPVQWQMNAGKLRLYLGSSFVPISAR